MVDVGYWLLEAGCWLPVTARIQRALAVFPVGARIQRALAVFPVGARIQRALAVFPVGQNCYFTIRDSCS